MKKIDINTESIDYNNLPTPLIEEKSMILANKLLLFEIL